MVQMIGIKENFENYRAISMQAESPKMLDYFINEYLKFDFKHLISEQQHGFCQDKSLVQI